MAEQMILIDVVDRNGEYVAIDIKFRMDEKALARKFLRGGFDAEVEKEFNTPYGKYWIAKIKEV